MKNKFNTVLRFEWTKRFWNIRFLKLFSRRPWFWIFPRFVHNKFEFLVKNWQVFYLDSCVPKMEKNDENHSPKPQTPNHRSSPFTSSPLQLIRNFASLSNRGSPNGPKSPFGRLFGKVRKIFWRSEDFLSIIYRKYRNWSLLCSTRESILEFICYLKNSCYPIIFLRSYKRYFLLLSFLLKTSALASLSSLN